MRMEFLSKHHIIKGIPAQSQYGISISFTFIHLNVFVFPSIVSLSR